MKLVIDRERCIGVGLCVVTAPAAFEQDDEGLVVLLDGADPGEREAMIAEAVHACPSGALSMSPEPN